MIKGNNLGVVVRAGAGLTEERLTRERIGKCKICTRAMSGDYVLLLVSRALHFQMLTSI